MKSLADPHLRPFVFPRNGTRDFAHQAIGDSTALGYALPFGGPREGRTVTLLRERGAIE